MKTKTDMDEDLKGFQIDSRDNVATALSMIPAGRDAGVIGEHREDISRIRALDNIPCGHKIALCHIGAGDPIVKYNVVIGVATKDIPRGSWVHLHNIRSLYDERSSHLDAVTGAPKDTVYQ